MPVTITAPEQTFNTSLSTYTTGTVTVAQDALLVIAFQHTQSAASVGDATSVTSTAFTANATKIKTVPYATIASPTGKLDIWAAVASGTNAAITINLPAAALVCNWMVFQCLEVDTSQGTLGIIQSPTNSTDTAGTSVSVTMSAFGNAKTQNAGIAVLAADGGTDTSAQSWTRLGDTARGSGPQYHIAGQATTANATSATWTISGGSARWGACALEIAGKTTYPKVTVVSRGSAVTVVVSRGSAVTVARQPAAIKADNTVGLTFNGIVVGPATNCSLMVVQLRGLSLRSVTGITYNSVAMTLVPGAEIISSSSIYTVMYYIVNPGPSPANIVATLTTSANTSNLLGCLIPLAGVNTANPIGNVVTNNITGANPSLSVSSSPGDLVIDSIVGSSNTTYSAAGSGQQILQNNVDTYTSNHLSGASSAKPGGPTSTTMSWTKASEEWAGLIVSIRPQT
jgi:hypothetical protein